MLVMHCGVMRIWVCEEWVGSACWQPWKAATGVMHVPARAATESKYSPFHETSASTDEVRIAFHAAWATDVHR